MTKDIEREKMNYEKEREAFEKHASKFFKTSEVFEVKNDQYIYDEIIFMWDCWLESAKRAEKKLEGCVVVPVEDIINLKRRIEHRYTNANEAINVEGWNPIISGHLDALDWAEQDVSEYLGKYVADVEAARGGNE